jgi:hypothetical protein
MAALFTSRIQNKLKLKFRIAFCVLHIAENSRWRFVYILQLLQIKS